MKRILLIIVGLIAALVAMAYALQPQLFTAEGRRARFLRGIEQNSLVVRRSCYSMETFVDGSRWSAMGQSSQEKTTQALAEYCREQGSSGQMTILDVKSRGKLAHWDGAVFQGY
jgi:hypothetical protein